MSILFSLLMMVLFAGVFVASVVYIIARFIGQVAGLQPGSSAWNRTVQALRAQLGDQRGRLVPWDGEMLSLLSLNRQDIGKAGWFSNVQRGTFTTIYHEPVLAYAEQRQGKNALVLAQTSNREYVYRIKNNETDIFLNGQQLGSLAGGNLIGGSSRAPRLLAQVEAVPDESQFPVSVGNRPAFALANPVKVHSPNPRALTLLRDLSTEEEEVALALAILQMVRSR